MCNIGDTNTALLQGRVFHWIVHYFTYKRGFSFSLQWPNYMRTRSTQDDEGKYMKRKDERSRKSKHCMDRGFVEVLIFASKSTFNNACWQCAFVIIYICKRTQIYYALQTLFRHIIPKHIKLSVKWMGICNMVARKMKLTVDWIVTTTCQSSRCWPYLSVGFPNKVYVENILLIFNSLILMRSHIIIVVS